MQQRPRTDGSMGCRSMAGVAMALADPARSPECLQTLPGGLPKPLGLLIYTLTPFPSFCESLQGGYLHLHTNLELPLPGLFFFPAARSFLGGEAGSTGEG